MIAHVLLTGIHQWLVIPALQLADGQGIGDETPAPLAREHLLMDSWNVPFGASFGEKFVEKLTMLRRFAEFFQFSRVIAYIEEQARVINVRVRYRSMDVASMARFLSLSRLSRNVHRKGCLSGD